MQESTQSSYGYESPLRSQSPSSSRANITSVRFVLSAITLKHTCRCIQKVLMLILKSLHVQSVFYLSSPPKIRLPTLKYITCQCPVLSSKNLYFKIHEAIPHTEEKPYTSSFCDDESERRTNMRMHDKSHSASLIITGQTCDVCGKTFES